MYLFINNSPENLEYISKHLQDKLQHINYCDNFISIALSFECSDVIKKTILDVLKPIKNDLKNYNKLC